MLQLNELAIGNVTGTLAVFKGVESSKPWKSCTDLGNVSYCHVSSSCLVEMILQFSAIYMNKKTIYYYIPPLFSLTSMCAFVCVCVCVCMYVCTCVCMCVYVGVYMHVCTYKMCNLVYEHCMFVPTVDLCRSGRFVQ